VSWVFAGLFGVIGFVIGWIAPAFIHVRFAPQIDIGNVLNFLGVLFVAVLINLLYADRASRKQKRTDLLLEQIKEVKSAFATLHCTAQSCNPAEALNREQQTGVTTAERELSNAVHSLELAFRECGENRDRVPTCEKLKDARSSLKDSITDSPYPGPYNSSDLTRISSAMKTFRDEVTRITFAVIQR
jgi:type II secretory pathway pseudopilin PulG